MNQPYKAFVFESYDWDAKTNTAKLHYSFDGKVHFTETVAWEVGPTIYDPGILDKALFGLWMAAGTSYYQAYVPPQIVIKQGSLDRAQKQFFDSLYLNGLSQFFYTNQLDPRGLIDFPAGDASLARSVGKIGGAGSLVALGGGKDSITAAELMKKLDQDFDLWAVYHAKRFASIGREIGRPMLGVSRKIDPAIIRLKEQHGAYNGHVPITAIIGFVGAVLAVLEGKKSLVWAIESSTDEPNTTWKGLPVNHQYAKSSMFEAKMANYLQNYVATDLEYYSILRPLSELRIAEIFCRKYFHKYKHLFSSCNANFTLGRTENLGWCGKCPKCAFIYAIFSPFLPKAELMDLFGGRDLFADEDLRGTFEQLLGIDGHKPLECVGEIAEVRTAIQMTKAGGDYPELATFNFPKPDYDYKAWHKNWMPKDLAAKLKSIIA